MSKNKLNKLIRYCGNKISHILQLRKLNLVPTNYTSVFEPYAGSMAFSLNQDKPAVGIEINADLCAMWHWLQKSTAQDLIDLNNNLLNGSNGQKVDLRQIAQQFNLCTGQLTYLRVNVSGVYTGQLNSWLYYPQHKLPIAKTTQCLPLLQNITIVNADISTYNYKFTGGELVFVDPPYVNTKAGYICKSSKQTFETKTYNPQSTIDLINSAKLAGCTVLFTYGDGASTLFPQYNWTPLFTRKVPNISGGGGTIDRVEYLAVV